MQQIMNLCWEQEPASRPQISQILKWCELPEFQSLRAVSPMDKGSFYAVCQCTVNRNHSLTLFSDPPNDVKFTLEHYEKFDPLFTKPETASPKLTSNAKTHRLEFKKSKNHTQVWITQEANENKTQLQILTYRSTQVGYRVSSHLQCRVYRIYKLYIFIITCRYLQLYFRQNR